MTVTVTLASQDDIPALAEINRASYTRETVSQLAFKNWPDEKNMLDFFKVRIGDRLIQPNSEVFKATDPASGQICGFLCWTLVNDTTAEQGPQEAAVDPSASAIQKLSQIMNLEFIMAMQTEAKDMKGPAPDEKHYSLSAFAVDPLRQGQGIGTQLLRHCLALADQAGLRTWLVSFPGSHSLYLRHKFTDCDYRDTDLNKWDKNRLRGYGIYRTSSMVREPQTM